LSPSAPMERCGNALAPGMRTSGRWWDRCGVQRVACMGASRKEWAVDAERRAKGSRCAATPLLRAGRAANLRVDTEASASPLELTLHRAPAGGKASSAESHARRAQAAGWGVTLRPKAPKQDRPASGRADVERRQELPCSRRRWPWGWWSRQPERAAGGRPAPRPRNEAAVCQVSAGKSQRGAKNSRCVVTTAARRSERHHAGCCIPAHPITRRRAFDEEVTDAGRANRGTRSAVHPPATLPRPCAPGCWGRTLKAQGMWDNRKERPALVGRRMRRGRREPPRCARTFFPRPFPILELVLP
jgi:hypothetical protein